MSTIGERIAVYRKQHNMTQSEFASKIKTVPSVVSNLERGGRCRKDTLLAIEKVVGEDFADNTAAERVSTSLYRVGRALLFERKRNKMTVADLSKSLGFSSATISRVENGEVVKDTKTSKALDQLAELFSDSIFLNETLIDDFESARHLIPNNPIYNRPEFGSVSETQNELNNIVTDYVSIGKELDFVPDIDFMKKIKAKEDIEEKIIKSCKVVTKKYIEDSTIGQKPDERGKVVSAKDLVGGCKIEQKPNEQSVHITEDKDNNIFKNCDMNAQSHIKLLLFDEIHILLNKAEYEPDSEKISLIENLINFVDNGKFFDTEILKLKLEQIKK